jgi:prepilin peptidase CpaA
MLVAGILLAGFVTLLLLAAVEDVRRRRLPNLVTGALAALFLPYALSAPDGPDVSAALALGGLTFLAGWALFARGLVGGGDVKLMAAVALWAGTEQILSFLLVTSLAGGALALLTLVWRQWGLLICASLGGLGLGRLAPAHAHAPAQGPETLPYGLAIAAGGLVVAHGLAT